MSPLALPITNALTVLIRPTITALLPNTLILLRTLGPMVLPSTRQLRRRGRGRGRRIRRRRRGPQTKPVANLRLRTDRPCGTRPRADHTRDRRQRRLVRRRRGRDALAATGASGAGTEHGGRAGGVGGEVGVAADGAGDGRRDGLGGQAEAAAGGGLSAA